MKTLISIIFILVFITVCCKDTSDKTEFTDNSQIYIEHYDMQVVDNLAILCKVWGFMKYYHPAVLENDHWDFELFRIMPLVINAKSKDERNQILFSWIKKQGKIKHTEEWISIDADSIKMYPDIDWIEDQAELGKNAKLLMEIKNAKRIHRDFTVDSTRIYWPLKDENVYPAIKSDDTGFRLLALFRYWNLVQYYFPYKYLIGEDWNRTLTEFIPYFIETKDELAYRLLLLKLVARINDTHAGIWNDSILENYYGNRIALPEITFVEGKATVTGFFNTVYNKRNCYLKLGDVILSVNNQSIDSIIKSALPYVSASNYATKLRGIAANLLSTNKETLLIEVQRNGECFRDSVSTYLKDRTNTTRSEKHKPLCQILKDSVMYIYLGSTQGGSIPENITAKGIIIDLRCYPSSTLIKGYLNFTQLYPKATPFFKGSFLSTRYPGLFTFAEPLKTGITNSDYYKGKKIILVNEITQSHAEYMAMRYRCAPNAIVIGSTTAGADGNFFSFVLPNGIHTGFTGIGIYYPDGTETQRIGIVPDIEVKPTIKGIQEGRDEVLEKAIELIKDGV